MNISELFLKDYVTLKTVKANQIKIFITEINYIKKHHKSFEQQCVCVCVCVCVFVCVCINIFVSKYLYI